MSITEQFERRANRAFAEMAGYTLIEDLSPEEQKAALEGDIEQKARYVRTAAGVRRFKRPIGAIILPGGIGSLDKVRIKNPVFRNMDLVEDRKGNLYDVGKDDSTGKYVALKHRTWDDQIEPQDSLDKALIALNEKLGGGTNSDREEGEKPAPKKASKKPSSDEKPQDSAPSTPEPKKTNQAERDVNSLSPDARKEYDRLRETGAGHTSALRDAKSKAKTDAAARDKTKTPERTKPGDADGQEVRQKVKADFDAAKKRFRDATTAEQRRDALQAMEKDREVWQDFPGRQFMDGTIRDAKRKMRDLGEPWAGQNAMPKDKSKPTSIGGQGSKERDAFIESHPKIKDVTDYHKPKLRDMSEKNFRAYVDAVEGGKSPNSVGPIMDRIDAGASWNPTTEKWVGQNSTKRPSSPTPTGDTSASDAADAAVSDRVKKMKDADRSKGRTNPYTSSLKPHQKDEVDALTPGEYATYMNARDDGHGHQGALHRTKNQPKVTYFGALRDADDAITNAKKNLSSKQTPEEQEYELKNRQKRLQEANAELGRHRAALPQKLDQMTSEQKAQEKEILAKYQAIDDAENAILRKRRAVMKKREEREARVADDAARTQKNREVRESLEAAQKFGNPAMLINSNRALLEKIVKLGRSGQNPAPHLPEVRERLAAINDRLSWTDDELGGYHRGAGRAESDTAAARHRANLTDQKNKYEKAVALLESQSKPKATDRERQRAEDRETMRQHERANFERAPFRKASSNFRTQVRLLTEKSESESIRKKRLKAMQESIEERERRLADPRYSGDLFDRDRTSYQASIDQDKKTLEEMRAKETSRSTDKPSSSAAPTKARLDPKDMPAPKIATGPVKRGKTRYVGEVNGHPIAVDSGRKAGVSHVVVLHQDNDAFTARTGAGGNETGVSAVIFSEHSSASAAKRAADATRNFPVGPESRAYVVEVKPQEVRPDGSTTQAAWGTSTRTSLPQGGGQESDDPIQRAVERGEISTREAARRRAAAQQSQGSSSGAPSLSSARQSFANALKDFNKPGGIPRDKYRALEAMQKSIDDREAMGLTGDEKARVDYDKGVLSRAQAKTTPRQATSSKPSASEVESAHDTIRGLSNRIGRLRKPDTLRKAIADMQAARDVMDRNGERENVARIDFDLETHRRRLADMEPRPAGQSSRPARVPNTPQERPASAPAGQSARRDPKVHDAEVVSESLPVRPVDPSNPNLRDSILDTDALAQMVTDGNAPSVPELNRAIRTLEAESRGTSTDDYENYSDSIRDLKLARDYIKERLARERAEFEAANTALF